MKFRHLLGYLAAALIAAAPMTIAAYADEIYDWSSTAANNNSAPPAGFPENMNYSEVNDAARELMAVVKRYIEAVDGTNTTAGTEPAYTLSSGQSLSAGAAGRTHVWTAHATSTGSVTLNVDAAGAKNVVDAFGVQLGAGVIVSGGVYMSVEEASTHQVIGTFSAPPVGGPASSTDNAIVRFNGTTGQVLQNSGIIVDDSNNVSGMGALASGAVTSSGAVSGSSLSSSGNITLSGTIDVGNADTTLSRASAGDVNIEGNLIYRASGTDVPVVDGGTGASTAATARSALAAFGSISVQRFTSGSGTYTPTSGTLYIRVRMVGGGGGGSAANGNAGSNGTATSFQSWTADFGNGAPGGTNGGTGGSSGIDGTGTLVARFSGENGGGTTSGANHGASGGRSVFAGAGNSRNSNGAGLDANVNTGSGGASGVQAGTGNGAGGGAAEYVEFYMTAAQIGASLSYSVGTAGAGGTAGTQAGGDGGSGIIIVEEFGP